MSKKRNRPLGAGYKLNFDKLSSRQKRRRLDRANKPETEISNDQNTSHRESTFRASDNSRNSFDNLNDALLAQIPDEPDQSDNLSEVDSVSTDRSDKSIEKELNFKQRLAEGMSDCGMSISQMDVVLGIVRSHKCHNHLPKTAKTLLHTPKTLKHTLRLVPPGEYIHLGIERALHQILSWHHEEELPDELKISFSTDGARLFKNGNGEIWPIQILIMNVRIKKPVMVGTYCGNKKPASFTDFFADFNAEILKLIQTGIVRETKTFSVKLECFIADLPARNACLSIKGHCGFDSCNKCLIHGERKTKDKSVVFLSSSEVPLRTDEDFINCDRKKKDGKKSAFATLPLQPVTQVPSDYMHTVCLGTTKKTLEAIIDGKFDAAKVCSQMTDKMDDRLAHTGKHCTPSDFNRPILQITVFKLFKATQYRQVLLYIGAPLLRDLF